MAEEIKKVVKIETSGGSQSVKDLRDQVEKLREILKTLDSTSDEYKSTLDELKTAQDNLSSAIKTNKTEVEAAEGSYNALSKQMSALKKQWKATNDEAERASLGKEIKAINDQLKEFDKSIGNNQRNVGNYAGSFQGLKEEIRQARDIMAGAARGSDEYAAAAKRAAEASNQLRDMQKEIAMGSAGLDNKLAVTSSIMSSISGGFAAAQGAMALFGAESENLQKTFVKLQAAMSMTQGFKALAELPKALNAAKIAFGGVTTGVKAFTKSLTGVKGAIAATGIGLLLVLLGELIANWDAVTAAVDNFVGGMDGLTEKLAGVANVIKNFISGPIKALKLAFEGNFSEAWNTLKSGFNITANYVEGKSQQMVRNTQKREQKKRQEFDKTKDDYIKDMEAQYGADWKYSKEGQKAYREFYNNKLSMYKKDSEEYKKAQREMWAYERELKEKNAPKTTGGGSNKKTEADKLAEAEKKAFEERMKAAVELYEELIKTETSEEEKLHKNNLSLLNEALENQRLTREQYDKAIEKETERHNGVLLEIQKKSQQELAEAAVKALKELQSKNEKELELIRADIARNIFPSTKEVELQAKKFNAEGGIAQFITGPATEKQIEQGVLTFDKYVRSITADVDALREYMANAVDTAEVAFFKNIVSYSQMAAEAVTKMSNKRRELNEAALKNDQVLMAKLRDEYDELYKEYELLINEMMTEAFRSTEDLNNLVDVSTKNWMGVLSTFFDWRFVKGEEIVKKEMENNNLELTAFIAASEERIAQIQKELLTANLSEEEKLKLVQEMEELKRQEIEKTAETEQRNAEITLETVQRVEEGKKALVNSTLDAIKNTGDILMNWSDNIVRKETKNGQKMSKEKEKQAKTLFNIGKALAISEAVVSTYQGAQEAFTSLASIPYVGPALGIAAAAAAVTAGVLRIQSIASQEFGGNSTVSDTGGESVGITSAVAVPQLEQTPYSYTSTITNADDEAKFNQPIIVQVSDIEDAMKVREGRSVETSF